MELPWRIKLRQAESHLNRFDQECARYVDESHVGFDFDTDIVEGSISVRLCADAPPPMLLGAIVGDVLHNLRSSLDSIAWETCQRAGVSADREHHVYFPIGTDASNWTSLARRRLPCVGAGQLRVFEELQPWFQDEVIRSHGLPVDPSWATRHPLARLHDLARRDRHRVPHPILARAGRSWLGVPEGVIAHLLEADQQPWTPGKVIVKWRVDPPARASEVDPSGETVLAFSEEAAAAGKSARDELHAMLTMTTEALRRIEVEVLEVVSPDEVAELTALRSALRDAQDALMTLVSDPHVIDNEYIDKYKQLANLVEVARLRYTTRWRELFE